MGILKSPLLLVQTKLAQDVWPKVMHCFSHKNVLRNVVLAVAYALLLLLSLEISASYNIGDLIWLPSGIAIAGMLLYGRCLWPGVFAGALLGSQLAGDPLLASVLSATGNTLDPLLGVWLLNHAIKNFDIQLMRQRDLWWLVLCAGLVGTLPSTIIGVPAYMLADDIPTADLFHMFMNWWMSCFIGVMMLTPLLLMLATRPKDSFMVLKRPAEAAILALAATILTWITCHTFGTLFERPINIILVIPFFIWAAARLGQRGTALIALLIYAVYLAIAHLQGLPSGDGGSIGWDLWLIGITMTLCGQFVAVMFNERKQAEQQLRDSETRYRALLLDASDAILVADIHGNLEEVNHAGEVLLGYGREELSRMAVPQIHPDAELPTVKEHFSAVASGSTSDPVTTKVLRKDGRILDVEIRPTLIEAGGRKLVQGIFIDLTERNRVEKSRLEEESAHRDALVREVHHRIKNNLHGITSVLRQYADAHPQLAELLEHAISQVKGVAVIHGLQGRASPDNVRICELTIAIAAGVESLWKKAITVEIPDNWARCTVNEKEAVPLALVLNELISNAAKHSAPDQPIRIAICHEPRPDAIALTIHNTGHISPGFGLDHPSAFGTGLDLVASLLPPKGIHLTWKQQGETVVTTLELEPPVIVWSR